MKYCRYCAFCISGDVYFCGQKDKVLNRIDKPTSCIDYSESELGDVETGKRYKPRAVTERTTEQQTLFEKDGEQE